MKIYLKRRNKRKRQKEARSKSSTGEYKKHWYRPNWPAIRQAVLQRDNYRCRCGSITSLQVHHLSYDRLDTPNEINDCITICLNCHKMIHKKKRRTVKFLLTWGMYI